MVASAYMAAKPSPPRMATMAKKRKSVGTSDSLLRQDDIHEADCDDKGVV